MGISSRIKQARDHFELSQEAFGERIGIHKQTVYKLESGKLKLSAELRDTISHAFEVNPIWLEFGKGSMLGKDLVVPDDKLNLTFLPLANVSASAGDGSEIFANEIEVFIGYDTSQLRREFSIDPAALVIIPVTGNSMEPTAKPGDRLWVMKYSGEPVLDGAIYVFHREYKGVIVKRVYWNEDGSLALRGDNPNGGPNMTITPGDQAEWKVVGRVLRVEKNL